MKPRLKTTVDYFQPDFYHFSQDSIFLAQKAAAYLKVNGSSQKLRCMDLCAGCGVVGLELASECLSIDMMDFVEIQSDFQTYFWQNHELILKGKSSISTNYYVTAFNKLDGSFHNLYDLIVCNPPYFEQGSGRMSPNHKKNCCRFFMDGSLKEMIAIALSCLREEGVFFFLSRESLNRCELILSDLVGNSYCICEVGRVAEASVFSIRLSSAYK